MVPLLQLKIEKPTPALRHASKVFFEDLCGFALSIVDRFDPDEPHLVAIEYSATKGEGFFIEQSPVVDLHPLLSVEVEGVRFPYATGPSSMMPFDPLALTALLTFLPNEQLDECRYDQHHRPESNSLWVVKNGLHKYPLLDMAVAIFLSALREKSPHQTLPVQNVFFEPTFDIDMAFAHKAKPMLVHGLGTLSLLVRRDFRTLHKRMNVWLKRDSDPYDIFLELLDVLEENQLHARFFAMTANRSRYDKNNDYRSAAYRKLLRRLSEVHTVGLHPGYASAVKPQLIAVEKSRLEDIVGRSVSQVRQHYLHQYLPETWYSYLENGLTDDYSTGFATHGGYKVGTCKPFQAFDVKKQQPLPLTLHPFALMDTALWHHQKYGREKVEQVSNSLKSNQQLYFSSLSAVWHNYAMPSKSEEFATFIHQLSLFRNHG